MTKRWLFSPLLTYCQMISFVRLSLEFQSTFGCNLRMSEASSTRTISWMRCRGDRSMTEWTVLSRVDQASLWKQMITLVFGRFFMKRSGALHLDWKKPEHFTLKCNVPLNIKFHIMFWLAHLNQFEIKANSSTENINVICHVVKNR